MKVKPLSPLQAQVVKLSMSGFTHREVAAKLGISVGSVGSNLSVARSKGHDIPLRRHARRSDAEMFSALRRYAELLGSSPSSAQVSRDAGRLDWLPVAGLYRTRFGCGWDETQKLAGLPPTGQPLQQEEPTC